MSSADVKRANDECPDCGCVGSFLGERSIGGPSVGVGSPRYIEIYECMAENCDSRWEA